MVISCSCTYTVTYIYIFGSWIKSDSIFHICLARVMEWTFSICFYILYRTYLAVCSGVMETFFPAYLIFDTYLRVVTKIYLCQTETFQIFTPYYYCRMRRVLKHIQCFFSIIIPKNFILICFRLKTIPFNIFRMSVPLYQVLSFL